MMKALYHLLLLGVLFTLFSPANAQLSIEINNMPGGAENQKVITISGFTDLTPISDEVNPYYRLLLEFGDGHYGFYEVGRFTDDMPFEYEVNHTFFNPFEMDTDFAVVAKATPVYSVNEEPDAVQQTITISTMDVPADDPEYVQDGDIDIELEHRYVRANSVLTVLIDLELSNFPDGFIELSYDASKVSIAESGGDLQWRKAAFMEIALNEVNMPIPGGGRYTEKARWQFQNMSDFPYTMAVDFEVPASLSIDQNISFLVEFIPAGPSPKAIDQEGKTATVSNSFDPNTYKVTPLQLTTIPGAQKLTYRLDFQNIGSAPENDVTLNVTPDPGWDLSTVAVQEVVSGTLDGTVHPASPVGTQPHIQLLESIPGKVVWTLENASLAGVIQADADPGRSLGHLIFEVETRPGFLDPCQAVSSNAMVIFGSNPPVFTNQAVAYCDADCNPNPGGLSLGMIILLVLLLVLIILEIIALIRLSSAPVLP